MRRRSKVAFCALVAVALLAPGCNWGRFTKLKKDTPVVQISPPKDYEGKFGVSLAVTRTGSTAEMYVGGAEFKGGGLVFELGLDESPEDAPTDESHCPAAEGEDRCKATLTPVGFDEGYIPSGTAALCFVTGAARRAGRTGLFTRCQDGTQFVLPVPDDVRDGLFEADGNDPGVRLAVGAGPEQALLAATAHQARAWFYEPLSGDPVDLQTPASAGDDFGAAVAVLVGPTVDLLAVSAPESGQIWIYERDGSAATLVGCLGDERGAGSLLAAGDVDGDGASDLLAALGDTVVVYSGAALLAEAPADPEDCSDEVYRETSEFVTLTCEETEDTKGCSGSGFPGALAVADVDGDSEGEIFVGAPRMSAKEERDAGAVLVYESEGTFERTLILSRAKEGDELGASLARVPQEGRDAIAVGAPGSREAYVFYCAGGGAAEESERCE